MTDTLKSFQKVNPQPITVKTQKH